MRGTPYVEAATLRRACRNMEDPDPGLSDEVSIAARLVVGLTAA